MDQPRTQESDRLGGPGTPGRIPPQADQGLPTLSDASELVGNLQALPGGSVPPPDGSLDGRPDRPALSLVPAPTPTQPADLLSFFEARPVSEAVARLGWSVGRELELLTQIAEYSVEDRTRILAMNEIRERIREALQTEGLMRQVSVVDTGVVDGGVRQVKSTGPQLQNMIGELAAKFAKPAPKELAHE